MMASEGSTAARNVKPAAPLLISVAPASMTTSVENCMFGHCSWNGPRWRTQGWTPRALISATHRQSCCRDPGARRLQASSSCAPRRAVAGAELHQPQPPSIVSLEQLQPPSRPPARPPLLPVNQSANNSSVLPTVMTRHGQIYALRRQSVGAQRVGD